MRTTGTLGAGFPAFLRTRRMAQHLTVEDLGARLQVSGHKIEAWESGAAAPRRDKWASLATALGVTVDDLRRGGLPARAANPDLATQLSRLKEAFLACHPSDRRVLLARAELLARATVALH